MAIQWMLSFMAAIFICCDQERLCRFSQVAPNRTHRSLSLGKELHCFALGQGDMWHGGQRACPLGMEHDLGGDRWCGLLSAVKVGDAKVG